MSNASYNDAKRAFKRADSEPTWLTEESLSELHEFYPSAPHIPRDPLGLKLRASERVTMLRKVLGPNRRIDCVLEVGCADGMIGCEFLEEGTAYTGVDIEPSQFDQRAIKSGAKLIAMDGSKLDLHDDCFDAVFSFDAMEHVSDPEAVLSEMTRVVRPGGFIFLAFGPLYYSPYGLHAFRRITVPYAQILFTRETMLLFAKLKGLGTIPYDFLNGWPLKSWRSLWKKSLERLKIVSYKELENRSQVDLIERFPSCFRTKADSFKEFIVSDIEILFMKRSSRGLI